MQRKLTAILSADVVGYSGLMEADETGTMQRLKANRSKIFDPHVAIHSGRQFKLMGDGALVEFASVIAAVNCALAIQQATEDANSDLDDAKRLHYRIGINLGEIIVDDDDIYGEGVNIAARIQALAPVGGVAVSRVVREQIAGKLACVFEDMGENTVKNIEQPVHVFSVRAAASPASAQLKGASTRKNSICVLPFANMSGDAEQEYFSDGISEDIITDLSKVSALGVIARNTSFQFKGKSVDVPQIAQQLKVSHILEGSVRKSGGRVRITAQLIDGATGEHAWAERYDRDLSDIFALQDEISEAIVKALKLALLPEEKKAIEQRGTDSVDAYNLYLMARRYYVTGNYGDVRQFEAITRLCSRATEIDPNYAHAWALMAQGQMRLHFSFGGKGDGGLAATERALALDASLPEAHAVMARILREQGRLAESFAELAVALRNNPDSYEVNDVAGYLSYAEGRIEDAIRYYEKATTVMEADFAGAGMLISCYMAKGDPQSARRAAQTALARIEQVLAQDQSNGSAIGFGVGALAALGEGERAKEWIARALLIDPDNLNMRYNFACTMNLHLRDADAALDLLEPFLAKAGSGMLGHVKADPDLVSLHDLPRFKAMIAAAEARLAGAS